MFSVLLQRKGRFLPSATPSAFGPRQRGQSAAADAPTRTNAPPRAADNRRSEAIVSDLPLDRVCFVEGKAGLLVVGQGGRMVQRAGVQPEAPGQVTPGFLNRPLKEPLPQ